MRLLVVSPAYPPASAGEAEHCRQIASRMAAAGHDVAVLTGVHPGPVPPTGFALRAVMKGWRWRDLPRLLREVRRFGPDGVLIVYATWLFGGHPMITFVPTILRRCWPRLTVMPLMEIYQRPALQGALARAGRKVFAVLAGRQGVDYEFGTLLRDSTSFAALGPTIVSRFAEHDPSIAARALVVPPPPLVAAPVERASDVRTSARAAMGVGDDDFLLAYFGYVYPGKGVDILIQALSLMAGRGRRVRLVMAGGGRGAASGASSHGDRHDGYEAQMRALAEGLGVGHLIAWPEGYGSDSDAPAKDLLAADVAVLPFDDGAELRRSTIAVVASLGIPLITTQPRTAEPAFVDGRSVLLSPPRDAQALALAVCRVADEPALRERLRIGSQQMARDWYSWDGAIDRISAALAGPPPRSARAMA